ncbi:lactose-specific PTS transporter subunit EIIC [Streptococcus himalayensis]|uniref:PTS system lactose-specific EIICB component n=1 Tax=Streptococcus himalayensis TaxID=1888195 RepID=A0A917A456_9STRE|nr:lactose-specific PTS transporter subunit EIIC [Streptococcus himalayensis]GGE26017.1 PTS system lactose-specific EIICB component [Streptococcus himalayensis]
MDNLVVQIEKMKPFFEKVSRNKYLRAIKDGFIAGMPIIIFSSIFMLIAYVPNIWGFHWSPEIESLIVKPYNYSMGILGLLVAGTTAKNLTDSFNRDLPATNQINNIATLITSVIAFLLLSSDPIESGFARGYLGTAGLLSAFIAAFMTVNIYNFFIKRNITIKMPAEVPPNIAQTFKDIFPLSVTVLLTYILDLLVRQLVGHSFAQAVIEFFQPLFSAADGYLGLAIIYGAMAMFWFIGIHGPSIVEPAVSAIMLLNIDKNIALLGEGQQATNLITPGLQYFVATMGGTGATLVVPFMFMWFCKAKQNRAIGRAAVVPTFFGVNEPILFGAPLVLNPVFMVPFIVTPILNVWIFKFFVEFLGMNSFSYVLPWTTPGPLGLVLGTGLSGMAFVLAILLIVVDVLMYYPFVKVYDNQILAQEAQRHQDSPVEEMEEEKLETVPSANEMTLGNISKKVLVLCAGGGTSGLLSNALNKAAKEYQVDISSAAGAYGSHQDILKDYDLVVLAPQVASNYEDIKKDTDRLGIKLTKTEGMEYINLTRDPKGSLEYVMDQFKE